MLFAVSGIAAVLLSLRSPAASTAGHGEYYALMLFSVMGMAVLVSAQNLVSLFLGFELLSIPLYILCASEYRREGSLEVGPEVSGDRVSRLGDAALRAGARLRLDRLDPVRCRSPRRSTAGHLAHGVYGDPMFLTGLGAGGGRLRLQGLGGAVSSVDSGRVRGCAHADHRVHGDRHQGGRARRADPLLRRRRDQPRITNGRRRWPRSPRSRSSSATSARSRQTSAEADPRLLQRRPGRLHARRGRRRHQAWGQRDRPVPRLLSDHEHGRVRGDRRQSERPLRRR